MCRDQRDYVIYIDPCFTTGKRVNRPPLKNKESEKESSSGKDQTVHEDSKTTDLPQALNNEDLSIQINTNKIDQQETA